jgi:CheY-like chemotaxis protein
METKGRVLVVEDEALLSIMLADMLVALGYEIAAICSELAGAVALARTGSFDLAVLDINLNGQRSFPVAEALQKRELPYLWTSGYSRAILPPRLAAAPFVAKPYDLADLGRALDEIEELRQPLHRRKTPSPPFGGIRQGEEID